MAPERKSISHVPVFVKGAIRDFRSVGSVWPSSRALASAMADAIPPANRGPRRILEVGAGTGAVSTELVRRLGPADSLTLLEPMQSFHPLLREAVNLANTQGATVDIRGCKLEEMDDSAPFDAIVACLPFAVFTPEDVARQASGISSALREDGVFVYYSYFWGSLWMRMGPAAERRRLATIRQHLHSVAGEKGHRSRKWVLWNLWPARVFFMKRNAGP